MKLGVAVGDDLERKNNAGMRTARFLIRLVLDASFGVMWSLSPVQWKHGCLARKNRTQPYTTAEEAPHRGNISMFYVCVVSGV